MTPAIDRLLRPVRHRDVFHHAASLADARVLLVADEVRVCPLAVEEVETFLLFVGESHEVFVRICHHLLARSGSLELFKVVALAPRRDDETAARFEHANHFIDIFCLVGHVLATLARPHEVEGVVGKVHVESIHHLKVCLFVDTLFLGELRRAFHLFRAERDGGDIRMLWQEFFREVARRSPESAPYVENFFHLRAVNGLRAPLVHFVDEVKLCFLEVFLLVPRGAFFVCVVPEVDVLSPVVLEHAFLCPRVVLVADGVRPRDVLSRRRVEYLFRRERNSRERRGRSGRHHERRDWRGCR
mmetsp:Transcript_14174/g.35544  ORF Transcript_14174/g.35544 Transcript_14174/m.35544 type:complete len:300 (-) Transcript_14174:190-1089(-)